MTDIIKSKEEELRSYKPLLSELSILKANLAIQKLEAKTAEHSQYDLSKKLQQSS